jgi:hypothetical protein
MKSIIQQVVELIKSYREDEIPNRINEEHVERWISQFEKNDREFILSELLHILPKKFLTRDFVASHYLT